jgi:dTDP-4-dehydrorhamnose reductase
VEGARERRRGEDGSLGVEVSYEYGGCWEGVSRYVSSSLSSLTFANGFGSADVATKYLETEDKSSLPTTLQFSSEDKLTKYEICELFAEIMGLPLDGMVANTEGNDPNASVKRPYDCHLSSQALKDIGINTATQDFKGWWRREARAFRK